MTTEIRYTLSTINSVVSAWGFGSFFRGDALASDADIVVVVEPGDLPLQSIRSIRDSFRCVGAATGLVIDLTILTAGEFAERPLLEMDSMVRLFAR